MIKWQRGSAASKTTIGSFLLQEFECSCGCIQQQINPQLLERLNSIRDKLRQPVRITSGYRCHGRQEELRKMGFETSAGVSQHELGNAADITSMSFKRLGEMLPEEFNAIGTGRTFYHVDTRDDKERRWSYR